MPVRIHADSRGDIVALSEAQDSDLIADLDDLVTADDSNSLDDSIL
jgi:hypothetical protein